MNASHAYTAPVPCCTCPHCVMARVMADALARALDAALSADIQPMLEVGNGTVRRLGGAS